MPDKRRPISRVLGCLLTLGGFMLPAFCAPPAAAQGNAATPVEPDAAASRRAEREKLTARWQAAYEAKKYKEAEQLSRELIELSPYDHLLFYNLACVQALDGRIDQAETNLQRAVQLGFVDVAAMQRDPDIAALRDTKTYRSMVAHPGKWQDASIDARLKQYKETYARNYTIIKDEKSRLAFVSGFSEPAFADARTEMDRMTAWFTLAVLPEGTPPVVIDEANPDPWVLVNLPTRADYNIWAAKTMGARAGSVGGIYDNDRKELVAQDLGATLRHEFVHVLHWRHCNRLGQVHPVWVQEGLCSLVEDVEVVPDGKPPILKPLPSWRTNIVRNMDKLGNLPKWQVLFGKGADKFVASRPLANYAVARAVFLYLNERGKLREWYSAFVAGFGADPTGAKAMEQVFGKPLAEIEKDWRAWIKTLPAVADQNAPSRTILPYELSDQSGDGLTITAMLPGAVSRDGPRLRDVVLSIDGQSVRDFNDLARVLGTMKPDTEVELGFRRGKKDMTAKVKLVERAG